MPTGKRQAAGERGERDVDRARGRRRGGSEQRCAATRRTETTPGSPSDSTGMRTPPYPTPYRTRRQPDESGKHAAPAFAPLLRACAPVALRVPAMRRAVLARAGARQPVDDYVAALARFAAGWDWPRLALLVAAAAVAAGGCTFRSTSWRTPSAACSAAAACRGWRSIRSTARRCCSASFPFVSVGSDYAGQLTGFDTARQRPDLPADRLPALRRPPSCIGVPLLRAAAAPIGAADRAGAALRRGAADRLRAVHLADRRLLRDGIDPGLARRRRGSSPASTSPAGAATISSSSPGSCSARAGRHGGDAAGLARVVHSSARRSRSPPTRPAPRWVADVSPS